MKILHIIPNLRKGGAERLVTDMVRELAARHNTEVRLIILHPDIDLNVAGLEHLIFPIKTNVRISLWRKNSLDVAALQQFIEAFKPDIIHSHLFEAELVSRSCYYPEAKWFSHAHGFFPEFSPFNPKVQGIRNGLILLYERYFLLRRYKANGGTRYLAVSSAIQHFVTKVFRGYCRVLPNAINTRLIAPADSDLNADILQLISVGRIDQNKNHVFLLQVMQQLSALKIKAHLHIYGRGSAEEEVKDRCKVMRLNDVVQFMGYTDHPELVYGKHHIYVHAAREEAFGLTLIEAMAAGLPVITLDGGGNRDLIVAGKNGFILPTPDAAVFAQHIADLWKNKQQYRDMSAGATEFARKFDIQPYVDSLLSLYEEALGNKE